MQSEYFFPKMKVLHYLFHKVDGEVVAHCLDLDIVAAGDTENEATERLNAIVKAQVESVLQGRSVAGNLTTVAPQKYWDMFMAAPEIRRSQLEIRVPQIVPTVTQKSALGILSAQVLADAVAA